MIAKVDFDKTYATEGDIITATLSVGGIADFAGYQVNLKYDSEVIQPIDSNLNPYKSSTKPEDGDILANSDYSPFYSASNDLDSGILNFSKGYLDVNTYKQSGIIETSGIIAKIKFKVLKNRQIQIQFENSNSMQNSTSGVCLINTLGEKIVGGFVVQQPNIINEALPINTQSVVQSVNLLNDQSSSVILFSGMCKVSGYIAPDITSSYQGKKQGFKVTIKELGLNSLTDEYGYFEISNVTAGLGYTIEITKDNYLKREIRKVAIYSDIVIGKIDSPLLIWAGDLLNNNGLQDNAINMQDIMQIGNGFNSIIGSTRYNANSDIDKDNCINLKDILLAARHFNKTNLDYPGIDAMVPSTPRSLKTISNTFNSYTISWESSSDNIGVSGYNIYLDNSFIDSVNGESTYEVKNLEPFKLYSVKVQAVDSMGNVSSLSSPVNLYISSIQAGVYNTDLQQAQSYLNTLKINFPTIDLGDQGICGYWNDKTSASIRVFQQWCYDKWNENINNFDYISNHWYLQDITPTGILDYKTFDALRIETSIISIDYTLPVPGNVKISSTNNSITVSWDRVEGVQDYVVIVDGIQQFEVSDTKYVDSSLQTGETHSYRIMAADGVKYSAWSPVTQGSTYEVDSDGLSALEDKLDELESLGMITHQDNTYILIMRFCAQLTAEDYYPNSLLNGNGDAFRHAYWTTMMANEFGAQIARIAATTYEYGTILQPTNQRDMDLYNDEVGITIGLSLEKIYGEGRGYQEAAVQNALAQGKLVTIVDNKMVLGGFTGIDVLDYLKSLYADSVVAVDEVGNYKIHGVQIHVNNTRKIGRGIYANVNDIMAAIKAMGNLTISSTVNYGQTSSNVNDLQKRLVLLGFDIGNASPDSDFGEMTLSAVISLQYLNSMLTDGKAGSATYNKINSLLTSGVTHNLISNNNTIQRNMLAGKNSILKLNSKGITVRYLQAIIKGYFELDLGSAGVDGDFGNYTLSAAKSIQYEWGDQFYIGEIQLSHWPNIYGLMKKLNSDTSIIGRLKNYQQSFLSGGSPAPGTQVTGNLIATNITSNSITWSYDFPGTGSQSNELKIYDTVTQRVIASYNNIDNGSVTNYSLVSVRGYKAVMSWNGGTKEVRATTSSTNITDGSYSFETLMNYIDALENCAKDYVIGKSGVDPNKLVLQFIRQNTYGGGNWPTVAGTINTDFINYVCNRAPYLYNVFGSSKNIMLKDPKTGKVIDFSHLIATMNGIIYETPLVVQPFAVAVGGLLFGGIVDVDLSSTIKEIQASAVGEDKINALCGWAGDLQTMIGDLRNAPGYNSNDAEKLYEIACSLLAADKNDISFSNADMLADVDAVNLSRVVENGAYLSYYLREYYYNGVNSRFSSFISNSGGEIALYNKIVIFTTKDYLIVDWPLYAGHNANPTPNELLAIRRAFYDYIHARRFN